MCILSFVRETFLWYICIRTYLRTLAFSVALALASDQYSWTPFSASRRFLTIRSIVGNRQHTFASVGTESFSRTADFIISASCQAHPTPSFSSPILSTSFVLFRADATFLVPGTWLNLYWNQDRLECWTTSSHFFSLSFPGLSRHQ